MANHVQSVYPGPGAVYNIADIVARNAALSGHPDKTAVIAAGKDGEHQLSYGQLNRRVNRLAHALLEAGVRQGDRVFVLMPNRIETLETILACVKIGAIYTPANFRLASQEIRFLVDDTEPAILVFDSDYGQKVGEILAGRDRPLRLVEVGASAFGAAKPYDGLVRDMPEAEPGTATAPEDVAMILFTAGTSGRPKGVKLTHRSTFFACLSNGISASLTRDDVYLGAPPMFHSGGLTCFQLYMLMIGGAIVLQTAWTARGALELIKKHRVTYHFGIATQLKMMTQVDGWEDYVGSLRVVNGGGEPQPAELKGAFVDRGITYISGYGLTETGATGFNWPARSKDDLILTKPAECMGKPPAFVEARLVDRNAVELGQGEVGEIVIRREPTGAAGYWNRPEDEAQKFRGDWIFTGDLGMVDEDGYFYVLGRSDDMIISGGENIYPAEIERVIFAHPKVANAVVVRGRHPTWGQTPKAIITPKAGENLTEQEIVEHVTNHLAPFKRPRKLLIVDSLPTAETGKIDRRKIRELYEEV
ncbi:MAG: AMP-binding protein [Chloroflexi bacterium]|nr:AMP-binding protein [Chloroflexota bacterium]MDA8189691.1 AMP-binding protein [Dehalococcoidales bacterium]